MKILAVIGSPHGMKGNTGRLLDEVMLGVHEEGGEIELLSLSQTRVLPCVACDVCHKVGTCPQKDGYNEINGKLLSCDAFILASPNYIFSITAQMKALFDRCCGLVHLMALEGKYGVAVRLPEAAGMRRCSSTWNISLPWSVRGPSAVSAPPWQAYGNSPLKRPFLQRRAGWDGSCARLFVRKGNSRSRTASMKPSNSGWEC